MRFNASVNTNNGVERQNKCLKYEYLETKKAKSVAHLLTILWNEFLPDLYQRYARQNLSSAEEAKIYDKNIPSFLMNRPGSVVKHCYRRWEESVNISEDEIDQIGEGHFLVRSQVPGSSEVYTINFSPGEFPIPSCSCEDWRKHHLICKYFCAVFRHTPWKWEQLPEEYRNNPFITIDDDVLHHFSSSPVVEEESTRNSEPYQESEPFIKGSQPLPVPKKSRLSQIRSNILVICEVIKSYIYNCKDEIFLQSFCTNLQNTTETLRDTLCDKNEFVAGDPEKSMTHIGTKKIRRLSIPKKRIKGTGRHGLAAEMLRTHSSKSIEGLLKGESDEGKIEEEVITIEDNDQCVFDTNVKSILKKGRNNSSIKKTVHFSDTCSSYQQGDSQQKYSQALQEVKKLWNLERGTGYVVGKVSFFNVTDNDIRSLYGTRWLTDQVVDAYLAYIVQREIEKGNPVTLYASQTMKSIAEGTFSVQKCRQKNGTRVL